MSDTRTVFIPAIALDYENNLLESVSVGGETFFRKQRDWRAIAKSYEQTIERMGAENAKLRELVRDMWRFTGTACKKYPRLFDPSAQGGQMVQLNQIDSFEQRMCELGIEVD